MKSMKTRTLIMTLSLILATDAFAGLLMTYHKLALKDLDEMNELVHSKVKESKKSSSGKFVPLKEGLQAVLARPNEDGMVEKVISPLKSELEALGVWEKTLTDLTQEAINALTNTRVFKGDVQVSYAVFLENLLAELKPYAGKEGSFERKLIEKIRDAKIEITKDAQKERKLRTMNPRISPSEIADLILKSAKPEPKVVDAKPEPKVDPSKDTKNDHVFEE